MADIRANDEACCHMMKLQAVNLSPRAVEDAVVIYNKVFDEYGIRVHDGGTSAVRILYCPWCGARLPESKRNRWFDELEQLGISEPDDPRIPEAFRSDSWWRRE